MSIWEVAAIYLFLNNFKEKGSQLLYIVLRFTNVFLLHFKTLSVDYCEN